MQNIEKKCIFFRLSKKVPQNIALLSSEYTDELFLKMRMVEYNIISSYMLLFFIILSLCKYKVS